MTYLEQLKHPNWQRRRLEVLSAADFKCSCCGDANNTLNVHHKQYIKGRKAWEYQVGELECLCETCHKKKHTTKDAMEKVFSHKFCGVIPSDELALAMVCGMLLATSSVAKNDPVIEVIQEIFKADMQTCLLGYAVGLIGPTKMFEIAQNYGAFEKDEVMLAAMRGLMEGDADGQS